MPRLTRDLLDRLLEAHQPPCVSIYMPVSPAFPAELEDDKRFHDLLKRAEREVRGAYPALEVQRLMQKCRAAAGEREFWNKRLAGFALFCSPDWMMTVDLPRPVAETVIVADSFHTKPLIRQLQTMDRYQVLCLTRKDVRLLEGDPYALADVPLGNMPRDIFEAFGEDVHAAPETAAAGAAPPLTHPSSQAIQHRPGMPDTGAAKTERWFRLVDAGIWERHSRINHLPLILCALPENQSAFRRISKNDCLLEEGIRLDPDHVPLERIRAEAWRVMEPRFQAKVRQAVDNFRAARAHHAGDDDVCAVAKSAAGGKVHTLLVEADRRVGGKLDPQSGQVTIGDINDPKLGDLLDDTAETVLRTGGEVLVMPPDLMPTDTGIAAVYRY